MANNLYRIEVQSSLESKQIADGSCVVFSNSGLVFATICQVDAVEVVHGRWQNNANDYPECDKCGYMPQYDPMIDDIWYSPYCPNCGAKMDKNENT